MDGWIIEAIRSLGVPGVGLLMFLENVFPPLPSEVVMPLAGYLSARGGMSIWAVVAAGSAGSLAGAALWYAVGRTVSEERLLGWVERHGAWLAMTPEDVGRARRFFQDHGGVSVLVGRLLPVVRTLISVPAGFSRMPLVPFLLYSAVGTVLWTGLLAWVGRFFATWLPQVERYLGVATWVVIGAALAWYVHRVVGLKRAGH
ncbi:MAG TPA: DedA family protein [Longimicrobiaceae bacterium]|nr:DedA family protein [Longimicrobiaceae bacterium]